MDFQNKLISLRKSAGLSQEELAGKIGVTRQTISKWELGLSSPELDKLLKLSETFDVSLDTLSGRTEDEYQNLNQKIVKQKIGYKYRSKKEIFGLPLIDINYGMGRRSAKGIIAIGNKAVGVIAIGYLSLGIISVGLLSIGLISLAVLSLGILSLGSFAFGFLSFGAIAVGYLSFGGVAVGKYAIGGAAFASDIAFGGKAYAKVAFSTHNGDESFPKGDMEKLILTNFPKVPKIILNIFKSLGYK